MESAQNKPLKRNIIERTMTEKLSYAVSIWLRILKDEKAHENRCQVT